MILVTGGAGYIGSHMVKLLLEHNYEVIIFDNLSMGHRASVPEHVPFIKGDLNNHDQITQVFKKYAIKAVMHFAANCYVGESVNHPQKYYHNNIIGLIHLLDAMREANVKNLIFSSSCAVYGRPPKRLIDEKTVREPISPYGRTKFFSEKIIEDYSMAYGLNYILLRYFNVAGADGDGKIGEDHKPETHLIPNILRHLQGKQKEITIFGNDYPTTDGTCIRDYIHVTDLVEGHLYALSNLLHKKLNREAYNLGTGRGYSILEVVQKCELITRKKALIQYKERRPGDPPHLVANTRKALKELKWKARFEMDDMIHSAWHWFLKHPDGYPIDKDGR
ncbi:UDP-glucose 4-epimerase GalE [Pseudalkalibacillus sp. Hm43]|uniref:UDP-glucose 4-epimerase GalE n=1 Tax=Pseudalkalibacillus sp. Hm43 TaxID=3450742 RepID=UPI003F42260A